MKVSIAMATYNGSEYIIEQLNSLAKQTRLPDEVIITDDCSTDNTINLIENFAKDSPFPIYLFKNKENLGYSGNFNAALAKTTGELVFLSDQDDVWFPHKIETVLNHAEINTDALIIMNDALLTDANLNSSNVTKLGQIKSGGLPISSFVMGCCCAIRRDLLDICLPIHKDYSSHDGWLVSFAIALNSRVIINEVLQFYRRHEKNESQFIANRTSKISPVDVKIESIKSFYRSASYDTDFKRIQSLKYLKSGIISAYNRATNQHKPLLKVFEDKTTNEINIRKKRATIRSKNNSQRIILVAKCVNEGFYGKSPKAIRQVARDILGYPRDWFKII